MRFQRAYHIDRKQSALISREQFFQIPMQNGVMPQFFSHDHSETVEVKVILRCEHEIFIYDRRTP